MIHDGYGFNGRHVIKALFFDFDHTMQDLDFSHGVALDLVLDGRDETARFDRPLLVDKMHAVWPSVWDRFLSGRILEPQLYPLWFGETFQALNLSCTEEDCDSMARQYFEVFEQHLTLYPDVIRTLNGIKSTYPSLVLGIITKGPTERQRRRIEGRGLTRYFPIIGISEELGVAKPNPEIFHWALREAHVEAKDAVMIGDDPRSDMVGAMNAGLSVVWVDRHHREWPDDLGRAPRDVASSITEAVSMALGMTMGNENGVRRYRANREK